LTRALVLSIPVSIWAHKN